MTYRCKHCGARFRRAPDAAWDPAENANLVDDWYMERLWWHDTGRCGGVQ